MSNNSIILVVDFASMFIDFKKITGVDDMGFITSQFKSLQKAFSVALVDGELSKGEFLGLIGTSIKSVVSGALSKIIDVALEKGVFITFARTMGNVIWSSLDIFKKISSGLQIIERAGGLLLPGRLAVERSVVVIRNPFQPVVRSITRKARKNETVTIQGRNFPFFSDPVVSFCTFSEDDAVEEGDPLKSLVAEILSKNSQTIIIKVPENFGEIFNSSDKVVVCIAVGAKRGDSRRLGNAGVFEYIPPPSLSSISPSTTVPSGVIFLRGDHFDTRDPSETKVVLNGGQELQTSRVGRDFISIILPANMEVGSYQVSVTYKGDTTQELGFTVQEPPTNVGDLTKGVWIVVTKPRASSSKLWKPVNRALGSGG